MASNDNAGAGITLNRIGIIAEYNPFHGGHAHQIDVLKKRFPDADIVIFMSGDFVQRGEPAIVSGYCRAKMAVKGGADIVLSPPVFASVSSAGEFAYFGIKSLLSAGCDAISFGCEDPEICDSIREIKDLAGYEKSDVYNTRIRECRKSGESYPAARESAVRLSGIMPEDVLLKLQKPNNLLAFEYIRALCLLGQDENIRIIPVKREGMDYHDDGEKASADSREGAFFPSAEAVRKYIREGFGSQAGSSDITKMPDAVLAPEKTNLSENGAYILKEYLDRYRPVFADDLSEMLFYKLAATDTDRLISIRDCGKQTANRIKKLLPDYKSFSQFTGILKSKDVTYTRMSRVLINILLDIRQIPVELPYMYVMACRSDKRYIISDIKSRLYCPLMVTGRDADSIVNEAYIYHRTDIMAHDIHAFLSKKEGGESPPGMFRDYIFFHET